jgi:prevent-host-death family protein
MTMDIPAGLFKAKCLELMDIVAEKGGEYVITKRGKPVAKLVAITPPGKKKPSFGYMKGSIEITGDMVSPLNVEWEAHA